MWIAKREAGRFTPKIGGAKGTTSISQRKVMKFHYRRCCKQIEPCSELTSYLQRMEPFNGVPATGFLCPASPPVVPYATAFKKSVQSILRSEVWGRGRAVGPWGKKKDGKLTTTVYTQSGIHLKTWPLQHPGCNGKIERLFVEQYVANMYSPY